MADREQAQKPSPAETETVQDTAAPKAKETVSTEELDDLLDEIDEVLETNAEEFVKSYVQKGGE